MAGGACAELPKTGGAGGGSAQSDLPVEEADFSDLLPPDGDEPEVEPLEESEVPVAPEESEDPDESPDPEDFPLSESPPASFLAAAAACLALFEERVP